MSTLTVEDVTISLTREELYERVWQTPMRTLAREFGISDVGLAKVCDRHDIPRPARGHWTKKAHGKRVRRSPLPQNCEETLEVINLLPCEPNQLDAAPTPVARDPEIVRLIEAEALPNWTAPLSEKPTRYCGDSIASNATSCAFRAKWRCPTKMAIEVSQTLRNPHPLVDATRKAMVGQEPDKYARIQPRWQLG